MEHVERKVDNLEGQYHEQVAERNRQALAIEAVVAQFNAHSFRLEAAAATMNAQSAETAADYRGLTAAVALVADLLKSKLSGV